MNILKRIWNHVEEYWMRYTCIFFILFPFLIGALTVCNKFVPWDIASEPKDWLSFWGSYISGIASFIVIFISIKQHKDLKKLQIDILRKDAVKDLLNDIRNVNRVSESNYVLDKVDNIQGVLTPSYYVDIMNHIHDEQYWFYTKYFTEINIDKESEIAQYHRAVDIGYYEISTYLYAMQILHSMDIDNEEYVCQVIERITKQSNGKNIDSYNVLLQKIEKLNSDVICVSWGQIKEKLKLSLRNDFLNNNSEKYSVINEKGILLIDKKKKELNDIFLNEHGRTK